MEYKILIPVIAWTAAFGVGVLATVLARNVGRRLNMVDSPDGHRKVHKKPIPMTGGFAILVTLVTVLTGLYFLFPVFRENIGSGYNLYFLAGAVLISFGMGVWDDLYNLRPRYKLLCQLLAAILAYYAGFKIPGVTGPFGNTIYLGYFTMPVTIFWYLGCMNAINLLDGLDGLAGGVGFFAALTLALIGAIYGNFMPTVLAACVCGAILAFLVFNFNPATIFLGDGGSMLIGFSIASISLVHNNKAEATVALAIPFIALGLPVFDTAIAMLRRWSHRMPVSASDRKHVHHILLDLGLSQRKVVIILYTVCVVLGGVALLLTAGRNLLAALMLGTIGVIAFFCIRFLGLLNFHVLKSRVMSDIRERSRSNKASAEVHKIIDMMEGEDTLAGIWQQMHNAFHVLGLDHASFEPQPPLNIEAHEWKQSHGSNSISSVMIPHPRPGHQLDAWTLNLTVYSGSISHGTLKVTKTGEDMPIRDTALLINELRHALADSLDRLTLAPKATSKQSYPLQSAPQKSVTAKSH